MVVAEVMQKPAVQVSVSSSSSSSEESDDSNDLDIAEDDTDSDAPKKSTNKDKPSSDETESSDEEVNDMKNAEAESSSNDEENDDDGQSSNDEAETSSNDEAEKSSIDQAEQSSDEAAESSNDEENTSNELLVTNEGWADSVAKILGSSKPKNKKTLVLSRAKKHSEIIKKEVEEKPAFEVIGDDGIKTELKKELVKTEEGASEPPVKKVKHEKPSIRVKPNILEKDREKLLNKIATKGVVQLFNAVRTQQKTLEKEIGNDTSETKKEKVLKKFDKRSFLDTLMGPTKSVVVDEVKTLKDEVKDEDKPRWNALRDDFMMGAKMKDWDKEPVDE